MTMNDFGIGGSQTNVLMVHQDTVFTSIDAIKCHKFPIKTEKNIECNLIKDKR